MCLTGTCAASLGGYGLGGYGPARIRRRFIQATDSIPTPQIIPSACM
jgi:hypothetical protein